jgi:tetratricopeptide (TPR) repeat protein
MPGSADLHWTDDEIEDLLLRAELPPEGARLFHLLLCFECQDQIRVRDPEVGPVRLARLFGSSRPLPATAARPEIREELYQSLAPWRERVERALREVNEANGKLTDLLSQPPERRTLLVSNSRRFQTLGLVATLLETVPPFWSKSPGDAIERSELALAALQKLPRNRYRDRVVNDFFARGWAYLGNSRRIASDFHGADRAFTKALRFLEQGSGDPLDVARVFDLESSLRRDLRQFDDARALLELVLQIARSLELDDLESKALIQLGAVYRDMRKPAEALHVCNQLLARYSAEELGVTNYLCVLHNRAIVQVEMGWPEKARDVVPLLRRLATIVDAELTTIRIDWLEATIHHHLGQVDAAEAGYERVRDFFAERAIPYDAALVSLDLLVLWLEQGRNREARQLAEEILPIFLSAHIHREALVALQAFQQAVRAETATVALARDLASLMGAVSRPRTDYSSA